MEAAMSSTPQEEARGIQQILHQQPDEIFVLSILKV